MRVSTRSKEKFPISVKRRMNQMIVTMVSVQYLLEKKMERWADMVRDDDKFRGSETEENDIAKHQFNDCNYHSTEKKIATIMSVNTRR